MVGIHIFENNGCSDRIRITVRDKYGRIKSDHYLNERWYQIVQRRLHLKHFSMTNVGFADVAGLVENLGGPPAYFTVIGIGTGTQAAAATDTKLAMADGAAVKLKTATTMTRVLGNVADDTNEWIATFNKATDGITGTNLITEVGIFNGVVNGTSDMLLHQVYTPSDSVNFDQGDSITVTVTMLNKQGT